MEFFCHCFAECKHCLFLHRRGSTFSLLVPVPYHRFSQGIVCWTPRYSSVCQPFFVRGHFIFFCPHNVSTYLGDPLYFFRGTEHASNVERHASVACDMLQPMSNMLQRRNNMLQSHATCFNQFIKPAGNTLSSNAFCLSHMKWSMMDELLPTTQYNQPKYMATN